VKVLVACEYSGIVRDAFLAKGHDAISCDLLPTDVPGPHYQGDVLSLDWSKFDLAIAHPPCTALAVSGNRWYSGTEDRELAAEFVWSIWCQPVDKLVIENPVGVLNRLLPELPRPYYIQPWQFGHGETKKTGLWSRGLPKLEPTNIVEGREQRIWKLPPSEDRWKIRSETFKGIAQAMAEQWG
jgi:site-specific DNA-cytosine methylase